MSANPTPPVNRMAIAVLSLAGFFVALYLLLSKLGLTGPMICGIGECETVQASTWSSIGPVPVAALGVAGYVALLAVSLFGLQPAGLGSRTVSRLLLAFSSVALAFSAYLTFLEAFVIRAWCQWCVISAILVTLIFVAALPEVRRLRGGSES
jgi:uncharacterized membrane protein